MLTDAEKVDVRRFAGYPIYGAGSPNPTQGMRYLTHYGAMEYRMLHMTEDEEATLRVTYLQTLRGLEAAIPAASANLDTDKAAVWTRNRREVRDREALFSSWCRRMCSFLGIPPGPALCGSETIAEV